MGKREIRGLKVQFDNGDIDDIVENIRQCLQTGNLYQGENVAAFERHFAAYHQVQYGIAVNSGCAAIEIPMHILGVSGKEVIVPTNTFIATALGVIRAGGTVRMADTEKNRLTPGLQQIQKQVTSRTAGVILVHIGGMIPQDIEQIRDWCHRQGLFLFEDAAHAHGSCLGQKYAGEFGIAASFSMFATKIITCGEGGIILTNDSEIDTRARQIRNYGKASDWITKNYEPGGNFRMSEITAAVALSQIRRLPEIIAKRQKIAALYVDLMEVECGDLGIKVLYNHQTCGWYKLVVVLPDEIDPQAVRQQFLQAGIQLPGSVYQCPLHKQPVAELFRFTGEYPNAEDICRRHIALPIYPSLEESSVYEVVRCLKKIMIKSRR